MSSEAKAAEGSRRPVPLASKHCCLNAVVVHTLIDTSKEVRLCPELILHEVLILMAAQGLESRLRGWDVCLAAEKLLQVGGHVSGLCLLKSNQSPNPTNQTHEFLPWR